MLVAQDCILPYQQVFNLRDTARAEGFWETRGFLFLFAALRRSAGCKPAIQQDAILRYVQKIFSHPRYSDVRGNMELFLSPLAACL